MDARVYWQIIAKAHKQAVAKHGVKKVRVIQAKATELAKTRARRCGTETQQIVMEGFALARKGFKVAALVLP